MNRNRYCPSLKIKLTGFCVIVKLGLALQLANNIQSHGIKFLVKGLKCKTTLPFHPRSDSIYFIVAISSYLIFLSAQYVSALYSLRNSTVISQPFFYLKPEIMGKEIFMSVDQFF